MQRSWCKPSLILYPGKGVSLLNKGRFGVSYLGFRNFLSNTVCGNEVWEILLGNDEVISCGDSGMV